MFLNLRKTGVTIILLGRGFCFIYILFISIFLLFFCPNEDPKVWLEGLDFSAYATIGSFCAASGLLGAIPLPGSRFFVVPSQVMMILALAAIYKVDNSNFWSVISHDS